MSDVVVTVPMNFTYDLAPGLRGLAAWAAEGDKPGDLSTGQEWDFTTWGQRPDIEAGERVYVVCQRKLRGYAPLVRLETGGRRDRHGAGSLNFVRAGGAVAVTIPQEIVGFRGWRYRWWERETEVPFPNWLDDAWVAPPQREMCSSSGHKRGAARALYCGTYRSPSDDSILAHQHLCTVHANSEQRFGHAALVPLDRCPLSLANANEVHS